MVRPCVMQKRQFLKASSRGSGTFFSRCPGSRNSRATRRILGRQAENKPDGSSRHASAGKHPAEGKRASLDEIERGALARAKERKSHSPHGPLTSETR